VAVDDVRLTAMGAYLQLFEEWKPAEIATPTLLVRAAEPMPGVAADSGWQASWDRAHTAIDVPGDHFTVLEEHAESTAQAVQDWLSTVTPQS
jgi:thioesterase domain-containing protein